MNILIVHNYYRIPGGEDTVVANEAALLRDHGHKVVLYTRSNNEFADLKGFAKLKKAALPFITIYNSKTAREVKKIIYEQNIDVVHVHNTLNLISPAVYYAAVKCGVPVVQTIHNFRLLCPAATFYREDCGGVCEDCVTKGLSCALKHKCYRGSFAQTLACVLLLKIHRFSGIYKKINYICLTDFNKKKLLENGKLLGLDEAAAACDSKGKKGGRVFVKPNFMSSNGVFGLNMPESSYFVYAGRLDKLKGIDFLLRAWKPNMQKLVVCGTGPMEDWCRTYVNKEAKSNIELRGFVSREEVMGLIKNAAGVILPTRWYEGFPMTIVESYSVGTPVIATDLGNAGDLVIDSVTGYRFETDDADSLSDAVFRVLEDGGKLRESTQNLFTEKYTEEKNYEELMGIYNHFV